MHTLVIGDIHGCATTLARLLERVQFNRGLDTLWLAGDLVNRGPDSVGVLRWARDLGESVHVVLGNQDLHLVAQVLGVGQPRPKDRLQDVLLAFDRAALVDWLRTRPFLVRDRECVLVHAGLHPDWTLEEAEDVARDLERALAGPLAPFVLRGLYEREFPAWTARMSPMTRRRLALAIFTRARMFDPLRRPELTYKGPPSRAPRGLTPWYAMPARKWQAPAVLFGHWSALGVTMLPGAICLDGGCYRGGSLAALRLADGALFSEPAAGEDRGRVT